ncbi:LON peptidase N-terminal domain and RING finger protein 2 [Augochlora pura]
MSHPIDFIDLTVDSPVNNALRLKNINVDNAPSWVRKTSLRRSRRTRQDPVTEVPDNDSWNSRRSVEIIDLDKIKSPDENTEIHNNNKCEEKKLITALSCPICYEELSSDIKPMSTPCGHIFCHNCLLEAIRISKRCPICKKSVKFPRCTRLHF